MIAHISEEQLPDDSTGKSDGVDITLGGGIGVLFLIEGLQYGVDLPDNAVNRRQRSIALDIFVLDGRSPIQVAVREETGATCNCRPATLPATLLVILQRCAMDRDLVALRRRVVDGLFAANERPLHPWDTRSELR